MSVSGISSSSFNGSNPITAPHRLRISEFQQLGEDLASGNLSAAQSDFAALQPGFTTSATTSSSSSTTAVSLNPIAQAFQQLASDLKTGNLSGAQQDYSTIQNDLKNEFRGHHWRRHLEKIGSGGGETFQGLDQLMQSSSSGSAASPASQPGAVAAQSNYAALAQELQQAAFGNQDESGVANTVANPVSLLA